MKDEPNKITATLKVVVTGEFYDDGASEEALRYCVEQDLEDAGFDVDVSLLKEQEPQKVINRYVNWNGVFMGNCPKCNAVLHEFDNAKACGVCGQAVKWNDGQDIAGRKQD